MSKDTTSQDLMTPYISEFPKYTSHKKSYSEHHYTAMKRPATKNLQNLQYALACETDAEALEFSVNKLMQHKFVPIGGISISSSEENVARIYYCQSMQKNNHW